MNRVTWRKPGSLAQRPENDLAAMLDAFSMPSLARFLAETFGHGGIAPTLFPSTPEEPDDSPPPSARTRAALRKAMEAM